MTGPAPEPVTVTEHEPEESVHAPLEKVTVPAPPVLDQVIVPVGEVPVTVAVHGVLEPTANDVDVQDIETDEAEMVRVVDPETSEIVSITGISRGNSD